MWPPALSAWRQVRRRLPWDARHSPEMRGRKGGGDERLRRVAQPKERRETVESLARLQALAVWKLEEKGASGLRKQQVLPPVGWARVRKRHCASPAGTGLSFPRKTQPRCGALMQCFITLAIPRPSYHSTFCVLAPTKRNILLSPCSLKTIDILNMVSHITEAPPQNYKSPWGVYCLPTPPLKIPCS